jgi:hypothetical protein
MPLELVLNRDDHSVKFTEPAALGCHTAVLAQSGSGKSFFVGRVMEEILIRTKARIVVLDPNSDFVRFPEINENAWSDPALASWFFPGDTGDAFQSRWGKVNATVLSNRNLTSAHPLRISWGGLSDAERASVMDIDPASQSELYWALVLASEIAAERWNDESESDYDFEHFRRVADELSDFIQGGQASDDITQRPLATTLRTMGAGLALRFRALVDPLKKFEIWRAVGDEERDIADVVTPLAPVMGSSVVVIDLLSASEPERLALTSRALQAIWSNAADQYSAALRDAEDGDSRVPTFLVIDEAHNLVPTRRTSPAAERLAADIARIAAEGRKFGLFLLLITQRPRKLDPGILSECDALFLMKMTNESDLRMATEVFGFLDPAVIPLARNLRVGDVFLQGRLGGAQTVWHSAPRRTRQGGRSLDDAVWTIPYPDDP